MLLVQTVGVLNYSRGRGDMACARVKVLCRSVRIYDSSSVRICRLMPRASGGMSESVFGVHLLSGMLLGNISGHAC